MKVSVLIPTHRRPKLLKRALKSIVAQTHKDLEILVYGDACTRATEGVVNWFHDGRIRYLSGQTVLGECKVRNLLANEAISEVVCWQDDDDISNIHRVALQLKALKGVPFTRCGSRLLWDEKPVEFRETPKIQNHPKFVTPTTMTWRKYLIENPYHEIMFGCDILWELEAMLRYGEGRAVPKILYYRDMVPQDRVTKVYQELDDYEERMEWQKTKRTELTSALKIRGFTEWPSIQTA